MVFYCRKNLAAAAIAAAQWSMVSIRFTMQRYRFIDFQFLLLPFTLSRLLSRHHQHQIAR